MTSRDNRGYEIDTFSGHTEDDNYYKPESERGKFIMKFKSEVSHNEKEKSEQKLEDMILNDIFKYYSKKLDEIRESIEPHMYNNILTNINSLKYLVTISLDVDMNNITLKKLKDINSDYANIFFTLDAQIENIKHKK